MARLVPSRALAYPGTNLCFVDESSIMYCFGSAARVTHLLPDKGDGDGLYIWEENEWAGISAVTSNWRSSRLALCPSGRVNPSIHLYSYPDLRLRGTLEGGTGLRFVDAAFCRDGSRLVAFGNRTDHIMTVWSIKSSPAAPGSSAEGGGGRGGAGGKGSVAGKGSGVAGSLSGSDDNADGDNDTMLVSSKLVEVVLPATMSFVSFNPANANHLVTGGKGGLYFWRVGDLVDEHICSCTRAIPSLPETSGQNAADTGNNGTDVAAATAGLRLGKTSEEDADELEQVVNQGDGKHDVWVSHTWGLEDHLWAGNEKGQLVAFDSTTGKVVQELDLISLFGKGAVAVGLVLTKAHLVIVSRNGAVRWMAVSDKAPSAGPIFDYTVHIGIGGGSSSSSAAGSASEMASATFEVVAVSASPMFDKLVVGTRGGTLHTVLMDYEKHSPPTTQKNLPATGITELRSFHGGRVVALASVRPEITDASATEVVAGLVASGGEDGTIRLWSAERGKLCGIRRFTVDVVPTAGGGDATGSSEVSKQANSGTVMEPGDTAASSDTAAGSSTEEEGGIASPLSPSGNMFSVGVETQSLKAPQASKLPITVCALAGSPTQPILAAGLCHGAFYILYLKQTSTYDVCIKTLWREQLYSGPVSHISFHPSLPLVAVASAEDRSVHVLNIGSPTGDFHVVAIGEVPPAVVGGGGGIISLMWRGKNLVFATEDKLVACLTIVSPHAVSNREPRELSWLFQTETPLHGMVTHPQIAEGPFFAVSSAMRVLQVLPALPEKPARATLSDPPALLPLDILEAHQKGAAVMTVSPDGHYIATGGADGLLSLWRVYEQQVEMFHTALVHSGPVISVTFSPDSSKVFSTSLDGTLFGLDLEGVELSHVPEELVTDLSLLADSAQDPREVLGQSPWRDKSAGGGGGGGALKLREEKIPNQSVDEDKYSALEDGVHPTKLAQRRLVSQFANRLDKIIKRNEGLPDEEKMERSEFVIDLDGRDVKMAQNKVAADNLRDKLHRENVKKDLAALRIRMECWDTMEAQEQQVMALQREGLSVASFAIRKRSPEEERRVTMAKRLRAMELRDIRRGKYTALRAWTGLLDEVPNNISWMLNEGLLIPEVDIVKFLRSGGAEAASAAAGGGSGKGQKGSRAAPDAKKGGKKRGPEDDDEDGEEDDDEDKLEEPSISAISAGEQDSTTSVALLYPPLALRTPRQKRTQVVLLQQLVTEMRIAFNAHVKLLYSQKEDVVDKIEGINQRLKGVIAELDSDKGFYQPSWNSLEQVEKIFDVSEEMRSSPYESEEKRAGKRRAEEERRRREEEASGDNMGRRALEDMMNGTLEVKQEALTADALPKPDFMEQQVERDKWSEEQRKVAEEYEAALKSIEEEQVKYRKALELEFKKLTVEVADQVRMFDDKVKEMADMRMHVQAAIAAQELLICRLAVSIVEREDGDVTIEKLDKTLEGLAGKKALMTQRMEAFRRHVDSVRDEIEQLYTEDRTLERTFKKDIQEASSNPIDMAELMAQLVQLYKLRESSGFSMNGSSGRRGSVNGMSSAQTSYQRSGMKHSSMRESAGMGYSRRKRSSRMSSGGASNASYGGMGPLQEAMKQAIQREKKAMVADTDPFGEVDIQLEKQASIDSMGSAPVQDLEYPGFEVEDQVWNKLLELRSAKIRKELEIRKKQRSLSDMKRQLDALQKEVDLVHEQIAAVGRRRAGIISRAALSERNLETIVKLKQGQDEVETGPLATDYSDAVLLPVAFVGSINEEIKRLGTDKVRVLQRIKDFRKSINMLQWDKKYAELQVHDLEEHYTDLHLLRVTKKLQAVIKGDTTAKDRELAMKTDQRLEMMARKHAEKLRGMDATNSILKTQLRDRLTENKGVAEQMAELKKSVEVRDAIWRSRMDATGGEITPAQQAVTRMKSITMRRKLVDLARAQTDEIEGLRQELDRLRQRTFPSFTHAARMRAHTSPDEVSFA